MFAEMSKPTKSPAKVCTSLLIMHDHEISLHDYPAELAKIMLPLSDVHLSSDWVVCWLAGLHTNSEFSHNVSVMLLRFISFLVGMDSLASC